MSSLFCPHIQKVLLQEQQPVQLILKVTTFTIKAIGKLFEYDHIVFDCEFYSSVFSSGNGGKVYIPLWHDVASILNNLSSMARRYALSTVTQLL